MKWFCLASYNVDKTPSLASHAQQTLGHTLDQWMPHKCCANVEKTEWPEDLLIRMNWLGEKECWLLHWSGLVLKTFCGVIKAFRMKVKPILCAIVVSEVGFRGPRDSKKRQLQNQPVVPPQEGYAKNGAESIQKYKICPNHWQLCDLGNNLTLIKTGTTLSFRMYAWHHAVCVNGSNIERNLKGTILAIFPPYDPSGRHHLFLLLACEPTVSTTVLKTEDGLASSGSCGEDFGG